MTHITVRGDKNCIAGRLGGATQYDTPGAGGFTLEVNPPTVSTATKLTCTVAGIELSHVAAKIKLTPAGVSVNDGALEVI